MSAGETLLRCHLLLTVPFAQEYWRTADETMRAARLAQAAQLLAEAGDELLFGGKRCREALAALVDAVAILSFEPGGVEIVGLRFSASPQGKGEESHDEPRVP